VGRRPTPDVAADISFTPDGSWFVFSTRTGKTIKAGFRSKQIAMAWLHTPHGREAVK